MKRPKVILPMNAVVCLLAFGVALPFAIAMFPQQTKVSDFFYFLSAQLFDHLLNVLFLSLFVLKILTRNLILNLL